VVAGGQVPNGTYRFVVDGHERTGGQTAPYHLESGPFRVGPWTGVAASDPTLEANGAVSFTATSAYPRSYESPFPYIDDDGSSVLCRTCSFRPWATSSKVVQAVVTVSGPKGTRTVRATLVGDRWLAPTRLVSGERAELRPGDLVDEFGETNGSTIPLTA
jgi:hypothetical protein